MSLSPLNFHGRVAIVTGAGAGLGAEHARLLASRGTSVVVNDVGARVAGEGSDPGPAERVAAAIEAVGGVAVADTHTVATPEGAAAIVQSALDAFGRVDIVINNAGILRDKSFRDMTPDLLDPVLDVHLRGAFYVTRAAWPHLRDQRYGRIVSTTSASGLFGNFGQSNYAAAKTALVGLTRVLSIEGARDNIRANLVAPGARTRMTEALLGELAEQMDPRLVSPVVAFLAHENCPVSGEIFSAMAGRVSRVFLGLTPGYINSKLSVEDVRDHLAEILDPQGFSVPSNASDEIAELMQRIAGRASAPA